MAATVLDSPRAVHMSILMVRAFLRLREWVAGHAQMATRLMDLERRVGSNDQELWEETTTHVRMTSSSQAEVLTTISRETRTVAGAVVETRSTAAPIRFRLDR